MAMECPTIPGRVATLATWSTVPGSTISRRMEETNILPGTLIPGR